MLKRQVKVSVTTKDKKKLKVVVMPPSYKAEQELKLAYAVAYKKSLVMGVATRSSMLEILKENNVWGDREDELLTKKSFEAAGVEAELSLALRSGDDAKQKELAIKLVGIRSELYGLVQIKSAPLFHTAEAIAEDVKLDKFIALCTFLEDGRPYFKDHEEVLVRRQDDDVIKIFTAVIEELSRDNIEIIRSLPENKWLIEHGMMGKNGEIRQEEIAKLLNIEVGQDVTPPLENIVNE
jgi:hypothetical protein